VHRVFVVAIYEITFPPLDPILPPFFPSQHNLVTSFSDLSTKAPTPAFISATLTHISNPIYQVLISVQHVSQLVPSSNSYPTASTSLVILTRMMTLLSHLMSLPHLTDLDEYSRLISESARYAVLLHVFTPWKGLPPDGTLAINHLMHRLISFILPLLDIPYPDSRPQEREQSSILLFWIVAVGGVASKGSPERKWFVGKLRDMCDAMDVKIWEDWKQIVSQVVWHEILCTPLHKKLWSEVSELRDREMAWEEGA
jgi:hypothetical protein